MKLIGIDNGVTGSIAIYSDNKFELFKTPVRKELSYTKEASYITRIDVDELRKLLAAYAKEGKCLIERPLKNPKLFEASISASRALEATLIVLEELAIPYEYIDSRKWQHLLLPKGVKGEMLKKASKDIARRLAPQINFDYFKDGDALLIAEYLRRSYKDCASL